MNARRAATNPTRDAKRVTVICWERASSNAMNVSPAATGWTARPRVHDEPIVTELFWVLITTE